MDTRTSIFTHSLKNHNEVYERATSELKQVFLKKKKTRTNNDNRAFLNSHGEVKSQRLSG
jgi:hypothetical protein